MRPPFKLRRILAALAVTGAAAAPAVAQTGADRYRVRPWPEGVVLGVTAVAALAPTLFADRLPHATCLPCDPSRVPRFDRFAIGPVRQMPKRFSDGTLVVTVLGAVFLAGREAPGGGRTEDIAVVAQSVVLTGAATNWIKTLVHRPRPQLYDSSSTRAVPDDGLSFPSGHASASFAAAAAYAGIQHWRGTAGRRGDETALLFGTAALTATLRVAARRHFPSDVVTGAVIGTAIGLAVPRLYTVR